MLRILIAYNAGTLGETILPRYIPPMDTLTQTSPTATSPTATSPAATSPAGPAPTGAAARFSVSERAAARIAEIVAAQPGASRQSLRVAVLAGGCSGFQYSFKLDSEVQSGDIEIHAGGARVLVDTASFDLLGGAQLDYSEALMGAHFTVRNPNATSSCGCGTSFSID